MGLFGPSRPFRRPTPMLVARGDGLDVETVLGLMRLLDRTLMIEAYRDRLVQNSMNENGLRFREGTDPNRSRFSLSVMNMHRAGGHDDGEDKDTLVEVSTRRDHLVVRVVGKRSPFRTGSTRGADPRSHPMVHEIVDHGLRVLHWAEDAIRACLGDDQPSEADLVSAAVVCGLEQRSHHPSRGRLAMRRCTLATPIHKSRTLAVERDIRGIDIRTEYRHPLIEAAVPACAVSFVDAASAISFSDGEIRLSPIVGAIEGMRDDPMTVMRHYDAANRITEIARTRGLLR